jgi:uncharacterized protein (TIGR03437 family)
VNTSSKVLLSFALMAGTLAAQNPSFTGVVNAGSDLPPGFPNSGLAQGCVFVIYGSNLGPGNLVQATTLPFPTNLAGTSITITVGGTTTNALIDYTSAGQVAAVLPSSTPVGNGTLTLTNPGGTSGSTPITVVASNFGIVTLNNSGAGPAVVTNANNQAITITNSAKPGDELVLWGTGLGANSASESSPTGAAGGNLPAQIQVFVGGISAQILYQGRTPTAVGLDQINFTVPPNAPLGCNVSIIVQTTAPTATVSNGPTISLAATDGATCSDTTQYFPATLSSKSSAKVMYLKLKQTSNLSFNSNGSPVTSTSATAQIGFLQFAQSQLTAQAPSYNTESSFGSCFTEVVQGSGPGSGAPTATYLNAGTSLTLTPFSGPQITLPSAASGGEIVYQNSNLTSISSGASSLSNGAGGPGVGSFTFPFTVLQPVTWTNELTLSSGSAIDRTQPLTITWQGGDANGYVDIQGYAQLGPANSPTFTVGFDCASPETSGSFTIPPSVLLAMPTGANAFAGIQVSTYALPYALPAISGFDATLNVTEFQVNAPLIFK